MNSKEHESTGHMPPYRNGTRRRWDTWVGLTTPDVNVDGPPLVGPIEGLKIVVTYKYVVTALIVGAEEATQTIEIVRIDVTVIF